MKRGKRHAHKRDIGMKESKKVQREKKDWVCLNEPRNGMEGYIYRLAEMSQEMEYKDTYIDWQK